MGLPPTPYTWHLGCSYHLHSSHHFLSTWGVVMLKKKVLCMHVVAVVARSRLVGLGLWALSSLLCTNRLRKPSTHLVYIGYTLCAV